MISKKELFTIPEAAHFCAVDRTTLWRWIKANRLNFSVTLGGHHRILKDDLESFMINNGMHSLAARTFQKDRILIVDDDPDMREILKKGLDIKKYRTETAEDGFMAGMKTIEFKPDLLILDLIMPGLDGFEVCKMIKGNRNTSHIKILVLTGYGTDENKEQVLAAGADRILLKPVELPILFHSIENLLHEKRVIGIGKDSPAKAPAIKSSLIVHSPLS